MTVTKPQAQIRRVRMSEFRRIHIRLSRRWDRIRAPWPIVGECHGHRIRAGAGIEAMTLCPQCDGSHWHVWRAWHKAPSWVSSGPGVPVRCRHCGGRKCDSEACNLQRHNHTHWQDA